MNALANSEYCSSGCESGWTLYLQEQSFMNHNASHRGSEEGFYEEEEQQHYYNNNNNKEKRGKDEEESDEEDLSMVSDASSWPPHFHDDEHNNYFHEQENDCFCSASKVVKQGKSSDGKKRQRVKEIQHNDPNSFLHDTASSHVFDFSTNNVDVTNQQISTESMLDCSQGFSATYFERRSPFQGHFGFLQPSLSENELQGNKWYGEKGIGMR